jgi:hypothetical protein
MIRVTDKEVREILDTDITNLAPFIRVASNLVERHLLTAGLTAAELKEIERWLAAHFTCAMDPRAARETVGDTSVTYEGQTAMGLDATRYGQMAKTLDPSGVLATLGKGRARIEVF